MNQMNPLLFQQQMIQNMQYRQPHYGGGQYRQNQNKQNQKEDDKKRDNQSTAGNTSITNQTFDDTQLQSQLSMILSMKQEQEGGDPNAKTKEQHVAELHTKLQGLVNNLVDKINKKHEYLMIS
jgi:hypothetical protein